jgi:uncharacterized protein (TIGR00725 family)
MGGAGRDGREFRSQSDLAERLAKAIASRNCVLITGATTGLPHMVSMAARARGALAIGISPAINEEEHVDVYGMPIDGCDVIIYTGFGLKGRNVINIRAADIVIIFGGGIGTLNEFTIAFDEDKVIGVVEGSGGIADHIQQIVDYARKTTGARLIFDPDPEILIDACLQSFNAAKT